MKIATETTSNYKANFRKDFMSEQQNQMTPGQAAYQAFQMDDFGSISNTKWPNLAVKRRWDKVAQAAIAASGTDKLVEALKRIEQLPKVTACKSATQSDFQRGYDSGLKHASEIARAAEAEKEAK